MLHVKSSLDSEIIIKTWFKHIPGVEKLDILVKNLRPARKPMSPPRGGWPRPTLDMATKILILSASKTNVKNKPRGLRLWNLEANLKIIKKIVQMRAKRAILYRRGWPWFDLSSA